MEEHSSFKNPICHFCFRGDSLQYYHKTVLCVSQHCAMNRKLIKKTHTHTHTQTMNERKNNRAMIPAFNS